MYPVREIGIPQCREEVVGVLRGSPEDVLQLSGHQKGASGRKLPRADLVLVLALDPLVLRCAILLNVYS